MERIRFIEHRGQRVLLADCSNCAADEVGRLADLLPKIVMQEPKGSVLLLADFSGSQLSRDTMERIKVAAVFNRPHLKRSAWVIPEGAPKPVHAVVTRFSAREIPTFITRDQALEYLLRTDAKQANGS